MNSFPYFYSNPFRNILINSTIFKELRDIKFNKNNFWSIHKEDISIIYDILDKIEKDNKIIMCDYTPFVFISNNTFSNKLFRPILSKVFTGYSHFDFLDFLIELTIFHRIYLQFKTKEYKALLIKLANFYPNEKNIFDAIFKFL